MTKKQLIQLIKEELTNLENDMDIDRNVSKLYRGLTDKDIQYIKSKVSIPENKINIDLKKLQFAINLNNLLKNLSPEEAIEFGENVFHIEPGPGSENLPGNKRKDIKSRMDIFQIIDDCYYDAFNSPEYNKFIEDNY